MNKATQSGILALMTWALLSPLSGAVLLAQARPKKGGNIEEAAQRLMERRAAGELKPENVALVGTWQGSDRRGKRAQVVIQAEGGFLSVEITLADAQGKPERTGKGTKLLPIGGFAQTSLEMEPKARGPVKAQFKIEDGKLRCSIIDGLDRFDAKLARVGADGQVEREAVAKSTNDNPDFTEIAVFPARKKQMTGLVADLSPDGKLLAMGAADKATQAVIYEVATQKEERRLDMLGPICAVRWSADGKTLAVASATTDSLLEQGPGREVKLFDVATWQEKFKVEHPHHPVSLSLSHDARTLAVASFVNSGQVGNLVVWNTQTNQELLRQRTPWAYTNTALTLKGDALVAGMLSGEPRLVVFDLPSGKQRPGTWKIGEFATKVFITPDGRGLAGVGNKGHVLLWDLATGKQTRTFDAYSARVHTAALLAGGKYLAIGGSSPKLQIYENRTGKLLHEFEPSKPEGVYHVAANSDASLLLTYGRDEAVRIWKTPLGSAPQKR